MDSSRDDFDGADDYFDGRYSEREELVKNSLEIKGLGINHLVLSLLFLILSMLFFIPKIYLSNNIYYASREIAQLQTQVDLLREENKRLKREAQDIRFGYLVRELDMIDLK